jgi:hypothetical protein
LRISVCGLQIAIAERMGRTAMISHLKRLVAVTALVGMSSACALSLRNPDIADLQRHPGRYTNHTVSVSGVVTSSWGVPLIPYRMYKVDDGTGEVTVLSQSSRMPAKGERVRVKGRVEDVAMFGGRALGLHIREEGLYVKRD